MSVVIAFLFVIICAVLLKIYTISSAKICRCKSDMNGKTVIITGANRGIGKETAHELAKRGAKVIMAVRDLNHSKTIAEEIISLTGNHQVIAKLCDLSSFRSIRSFADDINANELRCDVLICNAAYVPPRGKHLTEDGLEIQFGTNHFGHFLLTHLLLELLKKSSPSRVIIVSSSLYRFGSIDFDNINCEKYTPEPVTIYNNTKLANILFVKELNRRLQNTQVTVNALHPGLVKTQLNRRTVWYMRYIIQPIAYLWAKNPFQGSQTIVHLAVSKDVENISGKYFVECKESPIHFKCNHKETSAKLWDISERITQKYRE